MSESSRHRVVRAPCPDLYRALVRQLRPLATAALTASLVVALLPARAADTSVSVTGAHRQVLTTSQATNLSPDGQTVVVSGKRYDETLGIYVALCVVTPKGTAPTPCGGGVDKTGTTGASEWVSSNPPPYGVGLAVPFTAGGGFKVNLKVGPIIGNFDCRKVACAIVTKADHLNEDNRAADVFIPVTFGKATASATPKATATKKPTTTKSTTTKKK